MINSSKNTSFPGNTFLFCKVMVVILNVYYEPYIKNITSFNPHNNVTITVISILQRLQRLRKFA